MRYRCLIVDHDDTAVDSTRSIHYPAHLEVMRVLRPRSAPITLDEWFLRNFSPGIMAFLQEELKLSEEELAQEFEIWRNYTSAHVPEFFPGFPALLAAFRKSGGTVAVVSHSERAVIERDYRAASIDVPEMIYGWDNDAERRKPSPRPVREILAHYRIEPQDALIVDDLKPAVLMGAASGVDVAGAGWSHKIPEIRNYMENHCIGYFTSIEKLADFLLG